MIHPEQFFVEGHKPRDFQEMYGGLMRRNQEFNPDLSEKDFHWVVEQVANVCRDVAQHVHGCMVYPCAKNGNNEDTAVTFQVLTEDIATEETLIALNTLQDRLFNENSWEGIFVIPHPYRYAAQGPTIGEIQKENRHAETSEEPPVIFKLYPLEDAPEPEKMPA